MWAGQSTSKFTLEWLDQLIYVGQLLVIANHYGVTFYVKTCSPSSSTHLLVFGTVQETKADEWPSENDGLRGQIYSRTKCASSAHNLN